MKIPETNALLTRPSVRIFSFLTLAMMTLMSMGIILYATYSMYQSALKSQLSSMERVVEIAAKEQIRQIHLEAVSLGHIISQRKKVKQAYKNYLTTGAHLALQKELNDPLLNGYNYAASLELIWLRSYNKRFELVAQSLDALSTPLESLPNTIKNTLVQRQGVARVQSYGALWQDRMNKPYYSVILPVGGLRPMGYLEIVINPLFNLPSIENILNMPITIRLQNNVLIFESERSLDKESFMPVSYWVVDTYNKPIVNITAHADITQFKSQSKTTALKSLSVFFLLTGTGLFLFIWLLNHYLFQPLHKMVAQLNKEDNNDSIIIPQNGLLEFHILANAFNHLLIHLNERNQDLKKLSIMDGLTGIANRRHFDDYLHQQWQQAKKTGQPLSLLLIDIDHFKLYNDHKGHQEGDDCLRQVTATIQDALKQDDDMLSRYGGEEFAVILPHTTKSEASLVAERIMTKLRQRQLEHGQSPTNPCVTISIGISDCNPSIARSDDVRVDESCLIAATDQALYQAKELGRNRYVVWDDQQKPLK